MSEPVPERPTPQDDTPDRPRHTPTVPNPCGVTRDVLFVGDGVHVCEHIPDHARTADDREHICCCGFVWNDSEVSPSTPPDDTTPVAEGSYEWYRRKVERLQAELEGMIAARRELSDAVVRLTTERDGLTKVIGEMRALAEQAEKRTVYAPKRVVEAEAVTSILEGHDG